MANWQERIRKALEPEQQRLKVRQDSERLRAQQEKDRKLEIVRQEQEKATEIRTELLSTLEKIGARDLLEQVRKEVWTVGTVDPTYSYRMLGVYYSRIGFPCVFLALRYQYKSAYEKMTKGYYSAFPMQRETTSGFHGGQPTGNWRVFTAETSLVVKAYCVPHTYTGRNDELRLGVDNSYTLEHWDNLAHNSSTLSRESLDKLLLEDCTRRTLGKSLPLQLKARGKAEIERRVPIAFRLFN